MVESCSEFLSSYFIFPLFFSSFFWFATKDKTSTKITTETSLFFQLVLCYIVCIFCCPSFLVLFALWYLQRNWKWIFNDLLLCAACENIRGSASIDKLCVGEWTQKRVWKIYTLNLELILACFPVYCPFPSVPWLLTHLALRFPRINKGIRNLWQYQSGALKDKRRWTISKKSRNSMEIKLKIIELHI